MHSIIAKRIPFCFQFQIRCYVNPCRSHFPLLSLRAKSQPTVLRGFRSEVSIQQNNLTYLRSGLKQNKSSHIESLCKTFDLSAATNFSPFNNSKNVKEKKESTPASTPTKQEPCKKCAKIRNSVKKFFRAKFETENSDAGSTKTSLSGQPVRIRMKIFDHNADQATVMEAHPIENTATCFGCDQPKRESSIRGPPIISPVCNSNISACPLGEVFKNHPERVKKVIKIDRPRSLGPRKRMVDKDQNRETSVYETKIPSAR